MGQNMQTNKKIILGFVFGLLLIAYLLFNNEQKKVQNNVTEKIDGIVVTLFVGARLPTENVSDFFKVPYGGLVKSENNTSRIRIKRIVGQPDSHIITGSDKIKPISTECSDGHIFILVENKGEKWYKEQIISLQGQVPFSLGQTQLYPEIEKAVFSDKITCMSPYNYENCTRALRIKGFFGPGQKILFQAWFSAKSKADIKWNDAQYIYREFNDTVIDNSWPLGLKKMNILFGGKIVYVIEVNYEGENTKWC